MVSACTSLWRPPPHGWFVASRCLSVCRMRHAIVWELRATWARKGRVALTLERADLTRVEGYVHAVSATGATVSIGSWIVPLDRVLAIHKPALTGDSTWRGGDYDGPARRAELAGQTMIEGIDA